MPISAIFKSFIFKRDGASAVEFALLLPIFIFLLIACFDTGMFINERMQLHNTAQATADYVARFQDDANTQTVAQNAYNGEFGDITVTSSFECECSDGVVSECPVNCSANDYQRRFVSVNASGTFSPSIPYPGIPDEMDLSSIVRARVD